MTATHTVVPTAEELIARVEDLAPLLKNNAAEGERNRRVAEESIKALTDAGLFRIATPKRYGGYETSLRTMLDVSAAVAEADGGTSWVVTLTNVMSWVVGLFPERAQDEVFGADPDAKVSGVLTPTAETRKVEGGWRVTGKWFYNSGSWHATWAGLGIPITDETGATIDQGMALIPRADLTLEDTWFVAGMRSSGSNCMVAEDVFVPEHRVLRIPPAIGGDYPTEHKDEVLYRSALVPVLALVLVGPQLGMGKAALDLVVGKAAKKPISYTFFAAQQDSVGFQLQIAEASRLLDTARLVAYRAADDVDGAAARGEYPGYLTRARVRSDTGYVAECVTRALEILLSAHGAGSFAEVNPLQRIWRDSATAARHAIVSPAVGYEIYGKALLGVADPVTPLV
ncbi:oxidoreductase [Amycolatopsis rubida]|uniref:Oxidoreductase n=1 Tax=Amycolatopsis rubida TaxID=112413 RepID=A0ABX0BRB2_9PSEU|nr:MULTISPECIES: acyl-CoA dehydrogenase family protein [Amycolatopsis]MYW90401.1 oxidoreductase [Amycolatopsis rubida]NEC55378.1 oxidoreductase [Amycolatopsis rubida]OAP21863.1 Flavin-dependent monooxygenase, oxygenase subunit HsaA [Amycolatopsis sp. M39]